MSIESIGLKGIQLGNEKAAESAQRIVDASTHDGDMVGPMVDLKEAEHQVKASAKVVKVGETLTKALLDILA